MLAAKMVGLDARSTMDLDATVKGTNVSVEDVENIISSILSVPMEDGVEFQVKRISEIMEEAEYPRVRVSMETTFDGVRTPLKIDISTGDTLTVTATKRGTLEQMKDAAAVFDEVEKSLVMEKLWQSYQKNYSYAADLFWHTVMDSIRALYAVRGIVWQTGS